MNRDLNRMRQQGQANIWGEHSKKRGTTSTKVLGQEHAWYVQRTAKKPAYVKLSEQEGVMMERSS